MYFILLAFCVEHRAKQYGLYGGGVTLKLTYFNMKGITRSRITHACDSAVTIFQGAVRLLDTVDRRPVRLIGAGIYNLAGEGGRQLTIEDYFTEVRDRRKAEKKQLLDRLQARYHLDFAGHLDKIYQEDTLRKTVEYMRKRMGRR